MNEGTELQAIIRYLAVKFDTLEENIKLYNQQYNGDVSENPIPLDNRHATLSTMLPDQSRPFLYYLLLPSAHPLPSPPPSLAPLFEKPLPSDDHLLNVLDVDDRIEQLKCYLIDKKKDLSKYRKQLSSAKSLNSSLHSQLLALSSESLLRV